MLCIGIALCVVGVILTQKAKSPPVAYIGMISTVIGFCLTLIAAIGISLR